MGEDGRDEPLDQEPPENEDPGRLPDLESMSIIDANLAASNARSDSDEAFSDDASAVLRRG